MERQLVTKDNSYADAEVNRQGSQVVSSSCNPYAEDR